MSSAIVITIIVVALLLLALVCFKPKSSKQGWNQIGLSAFPSSIDPSAKSTATVSLFQPTATESKQSAQDLVKKWFAFTSQIEKRDPSMVTELYALFPDLQTPDSINYYGLSHGMISVLNQIAPLLDKPEDVTPQNLRKLFGGTAVMQFSKDINQEPISGLYDDPKKFGVYQSVW